MSAVSTSSTPGLVATGPKLGQIYQPDEQCRRMFSSTSALSRGQYNGNFEGICSGMWCTSGGVTNTLVVPAEGTSCGDRKWCENGQCVSSASAPDKDESCMFGDQPGVVDSGRTCGQMVSEFLGFCYNDTFKSTCCESCASGMLSLAGCEYGDRQRCSSIQPPNCYIETVTPDCCGTCNGFVEPELPESCKYGDKSLGCTQESCAASPFSCCETCKDDPRLQEVDTSSSNTKLPDWVIPLAAVAGGALILTGIIAAICCIARSRASKHVKKVRRLESSLRESQPPPGGAPIAYRAPASGPNVRYAQPVRVRGQPAVVNTRSPVVYAAPSGNTKPMTFDDFMRTSGNGSTVPNGRPINVMKPPNGI